VLRERVIEKGIDHRLHIEMEHAVGQRRAHVVAHRAMKTRVARANDLPAVGQPVVADLAVQDQRVGRDLQALVGRRQLVEEEDAGGLVRGRQELGREPDRLGLHLVGIDRAAQIDRLDRGQPQIDERHLEVRRDLRHHRRFADAARAPQHRRAAAQRRVRVLLDQRGLRRGDRDRRDVHRVAEHSSCSAACCG
jgi:hypothetical protein